MTSSIQKDAFKKLNDQFLLLLDISAREQGYSCFKEVPKWLQAPWEKGLKEQITKQDEAEVGDNDGVMVPKTDFEKAVSVYIGLSADLSMYEGDDEDQQHD